MANSASHKNANIARPYAVAAFEYARDANQLSEWKTLLQTADLIASQSEMAGLLANPEVSSAQLLSLFNDLLASQHLTREQHNFLKLLAENKRLMVLPQIADQFEALLSALEKISHVRVVTAVEIDAHHRQKLKESLTKRIKREVTLESVVDPSIIGGAVIYIGDRVIDGSIRGKLARLLEFSLR